MGGSGVQLQAEAIPIGRIESFCIDNVHGVNKQFPPATPKSYEPNTKELEATNYRGKK